MHDWSGLARSLEERIAACKELAFQVRGEPHARRTDSLTGRRALINPARRGRPRPGPGGCPYCEGTTPPTLSYVREARDGGGEMVIETEEETLRRGRVVQQEKGPDPYSLISALGERRRSGPGGVPVPLSHPGEVWTVRTFLNLVPAITAPGPRADCFVVGTPPHLHEGDLGMILEQGAENPLVPESTLEGVLASWALLEEWAQQHGLFPVPFLNGGKTRESGQSLPCFHAQFYALDAEDEPPFYSRLSREREHGRCPVCSALEIPELGLISIGEVEVVMHPAPARNLSFLVAPREEKSVLRNLSSLREMAAGIQWAVRAWEHLLGGVPAYNVALRTGKSVGHLHAEVVPRSHVNIPAGFEVASGFRVASADPYQEAERLRGLMRE